MSMKHTINALGGVTRAINVRAEDIGTDTDGNGWCTTWRWTLLADANGNGLRTR